MLMTNLLSQNCFVGTHILFWDTNVIFIDNNSQACRAITKTFFALNFAAIFSFLLHDGKFPPEKIQYPPFIYNNPAKSTSIYTLWSIYFLSRTVFIFLGLPYNIEGFH